MVKEFDKYLTEFVTPSICSPSDYVKFINRVKQGELLREKNPLSHVCAMFVPFDSEGRKILLVGHKKAKSWILPGGHVDPKELPPRTVLREAEEELGIKNQQKVLGPFSAKVLDINNPPQVCREHYDLFYALSVSPNDVVIDFREFFGTEWLTPDEALEKIVMEYYKDTVRRFVQFMKW